MTEEERQLLLELTGTVQIILERLEMRSTRRDFEEVVMPLRAKVYEAQKQTNFCPACSGADSTHKNWCPIKL